jgi:hypothetical protein
MKHELHEIRSGGQTGADIAGVMAAKVCGLPTSGWLPKGWLTQDGPKPQYAKLFNMQEHYAKAYPPRTYANVKDSDATIRFATNFDSSGERCTLKAIKSYGKPYLDIHPKEPLGVFDHKDVANWIRDNNIRKLNVAGNAKRTSPHIGIFTFNYLIEVFTELGYSPVEEMADLHKYLVLRLSSPEESPGSP